MFVSMIIVFREVMEAGLIVGILLAATERVPGRGRWIAARAEDTIQLEFRQHRFVPDHVAVPADAKFRVMATNNDDTTDEFEGADLNREKLVASGQTVTVFLGPLSPGEYKFFRDFHQDTAQGVMVAK